MKSFGYVVFISILFSSFGQVASDLYLPSLPDIAVSLNTNSHLSQATVFFYMIGYSVSYLVFGPLSDAIGRRHPLIFGLTLCLIGTILCLTANSIWQLMIGRCIQGFGAGSGVVIASAIVRDLFEGSNLAKIYSYLGVSNIIMIANAPLLGGYLQHLFGWRSNFIFLLFWALFAFLVSVFVLSGRNSTRNDIV